MNNYDFGGWATKYEIQCSDGRTIHKDAFKHCDGQQIPLVWNHNHQGPDGVIGKAILKHADVGVYAYCEFNDTDTARTAKNLVVHGDINSLSIYANKLKQDGGKVLHGEIRELSLVLAGANPGASIQEVLVHGEEDSESAIIYSEPDDIELCHSDENVDKKEKTVADIYNSMSEEQKEVVAIIADQLINEKDNDNDNDNDNVEDEEENDMKHNVFDQNNKGDELKHSEFLAASIRDAKKYGSLKESFMKHAAGYGIENIGELFPYEHNTDSAPLMIDRDQTWVAKFFNATRKSPFSRLKTMYADITADEARAKGYIKGKEKKEAVFSLLKRTTSPQTIYKKQKLDRDDIIDITDFDVVAWMKVEMRGKLEEEIARAMLIGDGRSASSDDKIKEDNIRPIYNDADLYTIKAALGTYTAGNQAKEFIKTIRKAMSEYEGTGVPSLYVHPDLLADMLLIEDANGRFIYENVDILAKTLRVKEIVSVPVMKGLVRTTTDLKTHNVLGIVVNPVDYTVGADKGGNVALFEGFDIDYNQHKYLIETRCSGSLLRPKSAITIEHVV